MNSRQAKRYLSQRGCSFEAGKGGHLIVRCGTRKSVLPMHGGGIRYPVELTREANGTVTVSAPDIPGAHSFGDNEAEALEHIVDAIETMILARMADREDIPSPSPARRRPTVAVPALSAAKIRLYETMREKRVGKAELAKRLGWRLPQIDRVLDLRHASRLDQIEAAFRALGRELHIEARPAA